MTRVIIILVLIFLLLSIIRNIMRRYRINTSSKNTPEPQNIDKPKKQSDADNIVDAKFEELK